jgi:microcystin-dependent protein
MAQPYVGEIRIFAGNFAPAGWLFCAGQLLPISENETLFQLIGTTYGGDGQTTFALPDLRGRIPLHQGNGQTLAQKGGVEQVTLTVNQIPAHTHAFTSAATTGNQASPAGQVTSQSSQIMYYIEADPDGNMAGQAIAPAGGSQPHNNVMPFLCVNYIISLFGIFPSPS